MVSAGCPVPTRNVRWALTCRRHEVAELGQRLLALVTAPDLGSREERRTSDDRIEAALGRLERAPVT